jgi:hypothetical protein
MDSLTRDSAERLFASENGQEQAKLALSATIPSA